MLSPIVREGLPLAAFLAFTTWRLRRELLTGVADGRFVKTRRDGDARRYWINVGLSGALLAAGFAFALWRAVGWMG
jgi:hypothetical protein